MPFIKMEILQQVEDFFLTGEPVFDINYKEIHFHVTLQLIALASFTLLTMLLLTRLDMICIFSNTSSDLNIFGF